MPGDATQAGSDGRMTQDPKEQKAEAGAIPDLSADLPGVEQFLNAWTQESDGISLDGAYFQATNPWTGAEAGDDITRKYLETLHRAHGEFINHNGMMRSYSEVYREKFAECLSNMRHLDEADPQKYAELLSAMSQLDQANTQRFSGQSERPVDNG